MQQIISHIWIQNARWVCPTTQTSNLKTWKDIYPCALISKKPLLSIQHARRKKLSYAYRITFTRTERRQLVIQRLSLITWHAFHMSIVRLCIMDFSKLNIIQIPHVMLWPTYIDFVSEDWRSHGGMSDLQQMNGRFADVCCLLRQHRLDNDLFMKVYV